MNNKDNTILLEEEILQIGSSLLNKTFGQLGESIGGFSAKGSFGQFIEKIAYNHNPNSSPEADFPIAGIELKVTPFKLNKNNTVSSKERLVLSIINYIEEAKKTFYTSKFWTKSSKIYLLFYLWESSKEPEDYLIMYDYLLSFSDEDLIIIKNDWNIIHQKILEGKAHDISEADTMYLAACTKGVNSNSTRVQPYSTIKAKQRAYSLKTSYMTRLLRTQIIDKDLEVIRLISNALDLEKNSFENIIVNRLRPYYGLSTSELIKKYNLDVSKNVNEIIVARLLGVKGRVSQTDEFLKANIVPKTIRLEENDKIIESMSFPTFRFTDIVNQDWDSSDLREYFDTTKFMFIIFKRKGSQYLLHDIKFWNMPIRVLDGEAKDVWEHTKNIILNGDIVRKIESNKNFTNFIGKNDNEVMHVRPHARNAMDTYPLPKMDNVTQTTSYMKHCFWLNNNYIRDIIKR